MKSSILLLVAWATALVFTGGLPNGYERVWIWYAFRIDCLRPATNRVMAPGAPKGCNMVFTELMDYIDGWTTGDPPMRREFLPPYRGKPQRTEKNPDIHTTAKYIEEKRWTNDVRWARVISPTPNGYLDMIRRVGATMGEAQADETLTKNNKALFTNMYQSLRFARGHRMRVNNDNIIKELYKQVPQALVIEKGPTPFGVTVDLQKTIEKEANNHITGLQTALDGITSGTIRTPESTHFAAVEAFGSAKESCYSTNCGLE